MQVGALKALAVEQDDVMARVVEQAIREVSDNQRGNDETNYIDIPSAI